PVNAVLPPARGLDAPGFTERRAEFGPAVPETQKYKSKSTPTWKAALWSQHTILPPASGAPSSLQDGPLGIRQPHRLSPPGGFCKPKPARPGSLRGPRAAVTAIRECAAALGDCLPAFPPFKQPESVAVSRGKPRHSAGLALPHGPGSRSSAISHS